MPKIDSETLDRLRRIAGASLRKKDVRWQFVSAFQRLGLVRLEWASNGDASCTVRLTDAGEKAIKQKQ